jgi:acetylornithine deacetylase/succinyl-diaminopimelate desuccinylase-like protein
MAFLDGLHDQVDASEPWFREQLKTLVEHKTVSPGKTGDEDIVAGCKAAQALMEGCGAKSEIVETAGTPSLLTRFGHDNPKAKLVIYNHFDVQPADASLWDKADPFEFEVVEDAERGFLYLGRGTTDDKGPALCALRAAMFAHEAKLPIDIQLLWETEEEIGSPNFGDVLTKKKDDLSVDGIIVSDTIWPNAKVPSISIGLRGGVTFLCRLKTGNKNVHSGLAGGVARNPLRELMALATAIDHAAFWKRGADAISAAEVEGFLGSDFDPDYFKSSHDLTSMATDVPLEMMMNMWARPTFEVHGLAGGYTGPGLKSIVPCEGELKASFRIVPSQSPEQLEADLRAFVKQCNPDVEVEIFGCFEPYKSKAAGPIHEAISDGMHKAFGHKPGLVREGGSIGAVPLMETTLGVPVHFLPLSLPEHGYHAPNERFDWKQARGGIEAFARVFEALARS